METKKFIQYGTSILIVMLPLFILSFAILILTGLNDLGQGLIFISLGATFLICILIFYKLTIYINDTYIYFRMGIGLISKKYLISDIRSCTPVKNKPLYGIGVRKIPDGWLYNVSGFNAIELTFKNQKSIVRIGTNNPYEISDTINKMIISDGYEKVREYDDRSAYWLSAIIVFFALIVPALLILSGTRQTEVKITDTDFSIKGLYGLTIKFSDITRLDTIFTFPGIKLRINGYAFAGTYKGNFRLKDQRNAKLFIKKGYPPYIFIKTERQNIYLNFKNPASTIDLFEKIDSDYLDKK